MIGDGISNAWRAMGHDVHACQDYLARCVMYIWYLSWFLSFSYCGWSHNGNVSMWPVLHKKLNLWGSEGFNKQRFLTDTPVVLWYKVDSVRLCYEKESEAFSWHLLTFSNEKFLPLTFTLCPLLQWKSYPWIISTGEFCKSWWITKLEGSRGNTKTIFNPPSNSML